MLPQQRDELVVDVGDGNRVFASVDHARLTASCRPCQGEEPD